MKCPSCKSEIPDTSKTCPQCDFNLKEKEVDPVTEELYTWNCIKNDLAFKPGDAFGDRYKIVEEIGRGGMGRVYKAMDDELNIEVALKMIHPEYLMEKDIIQRFKRELLLSREISHENVVRIHDFGDFKGIKFISMQYIDGSNLKELIQTSGTLTIDTALNIASQICDGLKAAHKKDIVHRDLKPQNIMIDKKGQIYITDFGLAESLESQEANQSKTSFGTPEYISPEQAKGDSVDKRSDIYAFGVILFEMLTGKPPFKSETVVGYLKKHLSETPILPSSINQLIPAFVEAIILKCMEKDPAKRYQNINQIQRSIYEGKARLYPKKKGFARLNRVSQTLVFAVLVFIIGLIVYSIIGTETNKFVPAAFKGKKTIAVLNFENMSGDSKMDHWQRALPVLLTTDLSQSKFLRVLPEARLFQILRELDQLNTTKYSSEILQKIATEGMVSHIIQGNYMRAGDKFNIALRITDLAAENIIHLSSKGIGEESLFTMVDDLTRKIKTRFDLSPAEIIEDIDKEIGQITTRSTEALRYYIEGKRYYYERNFLKSILTLEKAIEIDPEFALAHRIISENYQYLGNHEKKEKYLKKALNLLDHVSEKERYFIEGYAFFNVDNNPKEAIRSYKKILDLYPDDENATNYLGGIYRQLEQWESAKPLFEKVFKANKKSILAIINLAYICWAEGKYENAFTLLNNSKDIFPDIHAYYRYLSRTLNYMHEHERALKYAKKALNLDPSNYLNIRLMGIVNQIENKFNEATKYYSQLLDNNEPVIQIEGYRLLAYLYLTRGQINKSIEQILIGLSIEQKSNLKEQQSYFSLYLIYLNLVQEEYAKALDLADKSYYSVDITHYIKSKHFKGLTLLKTGKIAEAKIIAQKLREFILKSTHKKQMRSYFHLMGNVSLGYQNLPEAIEYFNKAVNLLSGQFFSYDEHALYMDSLASAYYQNSDLVNAQKNYERMANLSTGRLQYGEIYAKSFYMLGKIYQQMKMTEKALTNYQKFLQIWEKSNIGTKKINDAREQVSLLRQSSRK
jgi:tetratricopeptide (TPR) repeat protein